VENTILNLSSAIQLAAAGISLGAALYLARFKYTFIEELKELFLAKPERDDELPVTRRENAILEAHSSKEHQRFDNEFEKVWSELSKVRSGGK
jgi:hypothetical protein